MHTRRKLFDKWKDTGSATARAGVELTGAFSPCRAVRAVYARRTHPNARCIALNAFLQ